MFRYVYGCFDDYMLNGDGYRSNHDIDLDIKVGWWDRGFGGVSLINDLML